jgi:hypothetical protein
MAVAVRMHLAREMRTFGWVAVVASLLGLAGTANATLFAYEPFEYGDVAVPSEGQYAPGNEDAGTNLLGGQNPVIGPTAFYTGPWIQSGGDSQVVKAVPSLAYPGFPLGIGGIQQETLQFDCCTFGRSGREIAGGLGAGVGPRLVYESFLIDFGNQGTDPPAEFGFRGHELFNGGVGDALRTVNLFLNHFSGVNELSLEVTTPSGSTLVPVAGGGLDLQTLAATNGGTHLVVLKYVFGAGSPDVVSVYLDPMTPFEPVTPDAEISVAASDLVITHQGAFTNFTFSGAGHVPGAIDEIRWADTWAAATPVVPEPGTLSLLMLGLALLRRAAV